MKYIYLTNKISLYTTALLYLTLIGGLYAQIVLGVIQILSSLILLFFIDKIDITQKTQLYWYWTIVTIYGLCWLINWNFMNNTFFLFVSIILIPMVIASFFYYIIFKIYKNQKS